MDLPLWSKLLSMAIAFMVFFKSIESKVDSTKIDAKFKQDNLKIYPRKLIVMLKSFCYYFTLAFFPTKMGWFHEIGEPIDDKLKSFNFHAVLCVLLVITLSLLRLRSNKKAGRI